MAGAELATYQAQKYRHSIKARGGFDTASCELLVSAGEAETVFAEFIGCVVRVFVDNPIEPIWEGYIDRITYTVGGATITRSIDAMANQTRVQYWNANAPTPQTQATTLVNNATSQALFGVHQATIDAGIHYNNTDFTHKTTLRNTILFTKAYPQISMTNQGGSGAIISLEMRGLTEYAFNREEYSSTDTTTNTASGLFQRVSVGLARSTNSNHVLETVDSHPTTFGNNVQSNTSFTMSRESRTGQTFLQFMNSIVEAGDGTQQWAWGISALDPNTKTRRIYYKPASTAIAYTVNALSDVGRVRDPNGTPIAGWNVRPDNGVRINDILIGYNQAGDDPRVGYIESVSYDGESGLVQFTTGDNITMEGALGINRYFRATRDRFYQQRTVR
jgi:hypothetical protein